jgi:hypothetical protein
LNWNTASVGLNFRATAPFSTMKSSPDLLVVGFSFDIAYAPHLSLITTTQIGLFMTFH